MPKKSVAELDDVSPGEAETAQPSPPPPSTPSSPVAVKRSYSVDDASEIGKVDRYSPPKPVEIGPGISDGTEISCLGDYDTHPLCRLPMLFTRGRTGKSALLEYLRMHRVTGSVRTQIRGTYTQVERELWKQYQLVVKGPVRVPKDFFVAALRLLKQGKPLRSEGPPDIGQGVTE